MPSSITDKKRINGLFSPKFKVGDKVRLRKVDEIDELPNSSPNNGFETYKDWMLNILTNGTALQIDKVYTIIRITEEKGHHDLLEFESGFARAWIMISTNEKATTDSNYRTTEDGFLTCDDNWLPENRWF